MELLKNLIFKAQIGAKMAKKYAKLKKKHKKQAKNNKKKIAKIGSKKFKKKNFLS